MTGARVALALAFVAVGAGTGAFFASLLLAGCATPAILNPDPAHGGACHNGDQAGTPCKDGSCAPSGYRCAYDGRGWVEDPVGPAPDVPEFARPAHDAGADR